MTPQELAALPIGTRVRYLVETEPLEYDYGTVKVNGMMPQIEWDAKDVYEAKTNLIDLTRPAWIRFIEDISLDTTGSV